MEDFSGGWVKLWRWIMDDRIFANDELFKVWMWCLMKANHEDSTWVPVQRGKGQTEVKVQRGQMVFGRRAAAKELKKKPSTIYGQIKKLQDLQFLDLKPDTHWTIITIRNYDNYSGRLNEKQPQSRPHSNHTPMHSNTSEESREPRESRERKSVPHKKADVHMKHDEWFMEFYQAYPKHVAKEEAKTAWDKLCLNEELFGQIMAGVERYKKSEVVQRGEVKYIKQPGPWLNSKRWEDEDVPIVKPKPSFPTWQEAMKYKGG